MAQITIHETKKATIQTARLLLREAQPGDLDDFHVFFGDEDVMRYWYGSPSPFTTFTIPIPVVLMTFLSFCYQAPATKYDPKRNLYE